MRTSITKCNYGLKKRVITTVYCWGICGGGKSCSWSFGIENFDDGLLPVVDKYIDTVEMLHATSLRWDKTKWCNWKIQTENILVRIQLWRVVVIKGKESAINE